MSGFALQYSIEKRRLKAPFRISGYVFDDLEFIVVTLDDGEHRGRGEAAGVYYLGDDATHMASEIEARRDAIEACDSRERLRAILPPGGARNAIDCAFWELEASRARTPVWQLAGIQEPRPLITAMTLGADEPELMADGARALAQARSIKLKLTGELDLDLARVRAVRAARPEVWLGVDANQGYRISDLAALAVGMSEQHVSLIEQPLARGSEADLDGFDSPIPLAADESALDFGDVAGLVGRFDVLNIKLDKCGGLTEGLLMAAEARKLGLGVMVGNMTGTSLAMAPGFVLGQLCDIVDLDGALFLAEDISPGVAYVDGKIHCPEEIWGSGQPAMAIQ